MHCPECGTEHEPGAEACSACGAGLLDDDRNGGIEEDRPAPPAEAPDMKLIEIHSVQGEPEAHIIRSLLASHGIDSMTRSDNVPLVHPLTVDGLGQIRILVRESDVERAVEILRAPGESPDGL